MRCVSTRRGSADAYAAPTSACCASACSPPEPHEHQISGRAKPRVSSQRNSTTLEAAGRQRTVAARGGDAERTPWIPDSTDEAKAAGITDLDTLDAVAFYTERRPAETRTNRLFSASNSPLLGFDAFHLVGELLTQPVQVIVGGRLGTTFSFEDGKTLFERATNKNDMLVVDGAGHCYMYDKDEYVDHAIDRLDSFFKDHLK